jgi:hypothetical protein
LLPVVQAVPTAAGTTRHEPPTAHSGTMQVELTPGLTSDAQSLAVLHVRTTQSPSPEHVPLVPFETHAVPRAANATRHVSAMQVDETQVFPPVYRPVQSPVDRQSAQEPIPVQRPVVPFCTQTVPRVVNPVTQVPLAQRA